MKTKSKMIKAIAQGLLFSSVLMSSLQGVAQQKKAVMTDPKLGSIVFTDMLGYQVDEAYVHPEELLRMKIPVLNNNHGEALPAGSCKIKIGLGSKLTLDPAFDLNSAAMSNYFRWSSAINGGQVQITGELIAPLPANVNDVDVAFKVKGGAIGKSTVTANFLITNHHTDAIVSDEDGTNNASFLAYTVTNKPTPVSVITVNEIVKQGCSVDVSFSADKEINLVRYEVEISKEGINYEKAAVVTAAGNLSYTAAFQIPAALQVQKLHVRVKAVERSGRTIYTNAKVANGLCEKLPIKLGLYPNPVSNGSNKLVITATQGIFDGKYRLKMMDMAGKTVMVKDVSVSNVQNFSLELGTIAGGKYLIQVSDSENVQLGLLKFEKL